MSPNSHPPDEIDDLLTVANAATPPPASLPKPAAASSGAGGDPSVPAVIDDELQKLGWSPNARLSFLGDTGRENGWNRQTIFGGHSDPKNAAYNRGIISWQGDRRAKLDNYLQSQGVLGKNNDDELRGMVRFADQEMQNSPEWKDIHSAVRNPDISTYDASEGLRKYIKYVPDNGYNSFDPDFRVKNNAKWAEKAKSLGLGASAAAPDEIDALLERAKTLGGDVVANAPAQANKQPDEIDDLLTVAGAHSPSASSDNPLPVSPSNPLTGLAGGAQSANSPQTLDPMTGKIIGASTNQTVPVTQTLQSPAPVSANSAPDSNPPAIAHNRDLPLQEIDPRRSLANTPAVTPKVFGNQTVVPLRPRQTRPAAPVQTGTTDVTPEQMAAAQSEIDRQNAGMVKVDHLGNNRLDRSQADADYNKELDSVERFNSQLPQRKQVSDPNNGIPVQVDLHNVPLDGNINQYITQQAVRNVARQHGISPEIADKYIAEQNVRIPADQIQNGLDDAIKTYKDYSYHAFVPNSQIAEMKAMQEAHDKPIADETAKQNAELAARQQAISELKAEQQGDLKYAKKDPTADDPYHLSYGGDLTEEEIQARMKQNAETALTAEDQALVNRSINHLSETSGGGNVLSGIIGSAGRTETGLAGIVRPFSGLPGGHQIYNWLANDAAKAKEISAGVDARAGVGGQALSFVSALPGDLARLGVISKIPGVGAMATFGIENATQAAGEGKSGNQIVGAGLKGAAMDRVFGVGNMVGNLITRNLAAKAIPEFAGLPLETVEAATKIAAKSDLPAAAKRSLLLAKIGGEVATTSIVTVGTLGAEKISGSGDKEALDTTAMNLGFHLFGKYGNEIVGRAIRVWDNGKVGDYSITPDKKLVSYGKLPDAMVDTEVVTDAENPVYKENPPGIKQPSNKESQQNQPLSENQTAAEPLQSNENTAPVPESNETLIAQQQAAAHPESPRAAILYTHGETVPQNTDRNFRIAVKEGTLDVNPEKAAHLGLETRDEVKQFVADHGIQGLLGRVEDVGLETGSGVAVQTTDAKTGTELNSSIVTSESAARKQAELDAQSFPGTPVTSKLLPVEDALKTREENNEKNLPNNAPPPENSGPENQTSQGAETTKNKGENPVAIGKDVPSGNEIPVAGDVGQPVLVKENGKIHIKQGNETVQSFPDNAKGLERANRFKGQLEIANQVKSEQMAAKNVTLSDSANNIPANNQTPETANTTAPNNTKGENPLAVGDVNASLDRNPSFDGESVEKAIVARGFPEHTAGLIKNNPGLLSNPSMKRIIQDLANSRLPYRIASPYKGEAGNAQHKADIEHIQEEYPALAKRSDIGRIAESAFTEHQNSPAYLEDLDREHGFAQNPSLTEKRNNIPENNQNSETPVSASKSQPNADKITAESKIEESPRSSPEHQSAVDNLNIKIAQLHAERAPTEEVLPSAQLTTDGKMGLANAEASEVLRRALSIAFPHEESPPFYGLYLPPDHLEKVGLALMKMRQDLPPGESKRQITNLLNVIRDDQFQESGLPIVSVSEDLPRGAPEAREEELAHQADITLRGTIKAADILDHPAAHKAAGRIKDTYGEISDETLAKEVIAKSFRFDALDELGITSAEQDAIQNRYLELLRANGVKDDTITSAFKDVSDKGKEFADNAKRTKDQTERSSQGTEPDGSEPVLPPVSRPGEIRDGETGQRTNSTDRSGTSGEALAGGVSDASRTDESTSQPSERLDSPARARALATIGDFLKEANKEDESFADLGKEINSPAKEKRVEEAIAPLGQTRDSIATTIVNIRRAGMLTGLHTHVKVVLGNSAFHGAEEISKGFAYFADLAASHWTKERTTGFSNPVELARSIKAVFKADSITKSSGLSEAKQVLKYGASKEALEKVGLKEANSGVKAIDLGINSVNRFVGAIHGSVFHTFAYRKALENQATAAYLTARKSDPSINKQEFRQNFLENPTPEAIGNASVYADFATFQNKNPLSDAISKAKGHDPYSNFVLNMVLPIERTPTNLIARALDFSPVGFVKTINHGARLFEGTSKAKESKVAALNKRNDLAAERLKSFRTREDVRFEQLQTLRQSKIDGLTESIDALQGNDNLSFGSEKLLTKQRRKLSEMQDEMANAQADYDVKKKQRAFNDLSSDEKNAKIREVVDQVFTRTEQEAFAKSFGRASVGTIGMALGFALANAGYLAGVMEPSKDDKGETAEFFDRRQQGIENGSLLIPSVGRIVISDTPLGKVMAAGATLYEQSRRLPKKGENQVDFYAQAVGKTGLSMVKDQPLLKSVDEYTNPSQTLTSNVGGFAGSFVPTIVNDAGEVFDPKARKATAPTGASVRDQLVTPLQKRIPGLRQSLPEQTNGVSEAERGGMLRRLIRTVDPLNTRSPKKYQAK